MGYVTKTTSSCAGEVHESVSFHFETFEDFLKFESQVADKVEQTSVITTECSSPKVRYGELDTWYEHDGRVYPSFEHPLGRNSLIIGVDKGSINQWQVLGEENVDWTYVDKYKFSNQEA